MGTERRKSQRVRVGRNRGMVADVAVWACCGLYGIAYDQAAGAAGAAAVTVDRAHCQQRLGLIMPSSPPSTPPVCSATWDLDVCMYAAYSWFAEQ